MATQKMLKLVIIAIASAAIATNIQAGLIEPTVTTTTVSGTPHQISSMPDLFSTVGDDVASSFDSIRYSAISRQQNERYGLMPWDLSAFVYAMNGNSNLLELCLYGTTISVLRPFRAEIAANEAISYVSSTEAPLWENSFEFAQIATNAWLSFEQDTLYDWEVFCRVGTLPLNIQLSLYGTVFSRTELDEPYEWKFVSPVFCYMKDFFYNLSAFFEDSDQFVVTYRPGGDISPAAIPEPATLVLLGFGTLLFVGKRR